MSLILPTGEYVTVEQVSTSLVVLRFHKDQAQRAAYKAGTLSRYETTVQESRSTPVDLDGTPQATPDTIQSALITAGYTAIKKLPEFSEAVDA
jgi:transcriptional regulator GlxA family with amidase domain